MLVVAKANADPEFRNGPITETINMILNGEITAGRIMLRDYINATGTMDDNCELLNKHNSSINRMLGLSGNPILESIVPVIKACSFRP